MITGGTTFQGEPHRSVASLPLFSQTPRPVTQPEARPGFQSGAATADAATQRDVALARVTARAERADVLFTARASEFVLTYLKEHGEASSEEITDAAKRSGITPPDDRAFGPVYLALARSRLIEKAGFCVRTKGHGTSGGNIWRLV